MLGKKGVRCGSTPMRGGALVVWSFGRLVVWSFGRTHTRQAGYCIAPLDSTARILYYQGVHKEGTP